MCQAASQFSAKVLALWPYCPGSSVLGFHRPACEGSWGLEGHAWGTQHSPWPRLYIWELWFSLYSATSCLRIVAAHGQVLSWPAGWGAPHRAGATVTCRERDVPPNPPMAAMLGPVCGHQGWPGWVRAVFSLRVTNKVSTSQHGHLTTPVLGTSQATSSLAWKAGAVLGEQGAGDRASWGVGRGAQTPRWTKLNKGKGRAAWESRAEVPSHHRAHPAFSPLPSFVSLHKPAPRIGSRTRPQTRGCLTQSHSSARRCRGLQEEQEATAQGPKPGWLRAASA